MSNRVSNLVELLQSRVQQKPLQRVFTFLDESEAEAATLTYQQLDQRARAIAAALQQLHARGERVLLLFPPGLDYVSAFWGCLYAGAIAVPAYPPRQNRSLLRLQSVTADAGAKIALTTRALLAKTHGWESRCPDLKALRWLATDSVAENLAEYWRNLSVTESDLAFLQYTSGSVATPKGVMVSHGNLLSNEGMIQEAFAQTEESVIVGWLPLYHDMGLIGNVLQPVYSGSQCVLMSPVSFLQEPFRWLSAITRYRATTSGGPNFAYDLCVRKIDPERRASLDLSSWKIAFNGAEPVRASSLNAFAEAFGPSGFRREAFRPCYGLAEATLLVSSNDAPSAKSVDSEALQNNLITETAEGARWLVSCGRPAQGQQIHILRPETLAECAPGEIGEICVSGPNVTAGYWNRPDEIERSFQQLTPTDKPQSLLRTGDLGAFLDGELFVTGRLKDLIIIRGRNHYPQDIERTVELSHPALRPGSGAAFVVETDEEERLVVAQELNGRGRVDAEEIVRAITHAVLEEHELQLHAVVLLKPGSIPKTSSGKIQRFACREKFVSGEFAPVADWHYQSHAANDRELESVEDWLRTEVAVHSGVDVSKIDVNQPLSAYALDSLKAIELTYAIERRLGVVLSMAELLESPSIAQIAARAQVGPIKAAEIQATSEPSTDQPLSAGQQALWFLHQLEPESSAYNIASAVRVVSDLNVSALRRAFQSLVNRQSSLRVTFSTQQGAPVQRVAESAEPYFREVDASDWRDELFDQRLVEEANRPFDLENGPLLRVHLFRRAQHNHVLLIVVHHIIADFWSLSVLTNELGAIYTAAVSGSPLELQPPELQYAGYVHKQEALLAGPEGERLWQYWQKQLNGELPLLNLPTEHARPPVQTYRGSSESFKLDEEVTRGLKELSREHGATLYTTLLAAFEVLLFRYTGQEDILVGSPTSGRTENGLADLVGYFVNPVVLRSHPKASETFSSFLDQTRTTVLEALQHQSYPFPLLVEKLQPQRDASRSPLFQVMFILQKAHLLNELTELVLGEGGRRVRAGALELESVALSQQISQFDLTLTMVESGETISGSLQFNTDLFTRSQIERMIGHLKTLLRAITTTPEQSLAELPMLTQAEAQQLLVDWNQTSTAYPQNLCLHQLFEEQARLQPERVALICGEQRISYGELEARADQLAHYLKALGVGPERFVGLLLERSADLVVAILAVLKAGGAYLPLDPAYPEERLRFMLEDTRAGILITQNSLLGLAEKLAANSNVVVCFERDRNVIANQPASTPVPTAIAENMAYVIYTSGSTGIPKGVVINHASAVVMVQWARDYFTREQLAGVLASTSISFDLSVFELFAPLHAGGAVILSENVLQLPLLPARNEVTLVNTVPSAIAELLRAASVPPNVKTFCLAGEALSRELVDGIYAPGTTREVFNLYGPSEDTTYSTYALISQEETGAPVIGRPLSETQLYVLDAAGQPVPVGVPGELFIGGRGLGRGYWHRPDITADRFVPDPFGAKPGARLYRTGDLVRYRQDGMLEYLGRVDHQVKVRGYRIELEEIESALRRHAQVKEAVVVVTERNADKGLLAYVVMHSETTAEELRNWLLERLPAYMLPQGFIFLDELPLTPNGKTDRKALPPWSESARETTLAPRTETESGVAQIWQEVLKLEAVSVDDNFFLLGGHSLLATRMMSQVESRFGMRVSLRDFFANPTIASLAGLIEKCEGHSHLPILKAHSRTQNAPLSHAQSRLWFLHQYERDNTAYNMPGAVRLLGDLDVNVLEQSLTEVIRRHEILRTVFVMSEDEPAQVVLPSRRLRIPVTDLSDVPESERETEALRLATVAAQQPFDLSAGPLIRFSLLRLNTREHLLLMTVHHIVFDGWSIGVLMQELSELYEAYLNGGEASLAELPVQYADYAIWQRDWLQGEVLDEQLAYWQRQLANAPEALNLPTDKPRAAAQSFNGETLPFELPSTLVKELKQLADEQDATLFMVLLAAFQVLLARYSGQTDVLVGATVANRNRAEVEGLIGFFVNMLVMRGNVSGDPAFTAYLNQVREVAVEAYAHQDLPFELLIESLDMPRSPGRTPLFQVAFAMQNVPTAELELPGLKLELVKVESGRAPFDLTLSLSETEDQRIAGTFNYNSDLFHSATIERMQGHYRTLLEGLVSEPQRRISELPLVTGTEQHELLAVWNHTASAPVESTIQELFEEQVRQTPRAVALIAGEQQLTYKALNERANQLAHYLRRLGVGPEVAVGLCVQRSVELIVGVLGILKAGGAYVPLDAQYPAERLRYMVNDAQIKVLLTEEAAVTAFTGFCSEVVSLERATELFAAESRENPETKTSGKNLAYVLYTSGSTGQPKGVNVEQRGVVRLVKNTSYARFSSEEVFLQLAPSSFDASTFEIWGALLNGARLVLMPPEAPSLEKLGEVIRKHQISTLWLTAGLFNLMVDEQLEDLKSLKQLLAGGDVLSVAHVNKFLAENSDCRLINGYGPTENTTFTCCYSIDDHPVIGSVPLGYPISNTEIYILDEHQRPVPTGVAGELYIGGQGLARGYANEFAMTAEKFVPHPYSDKPGERLYRTGDLVRYLPGGLIEFFGRRDKQVKVRGFRVELSEIETVLCQHQSVRQAIVIVAQRAEVEDKQLLAFLTLESEITAGELRSYLQQKLPEYMMPQGFTFVDELPLTTNGKVDRNALLACMKRDTSDDNGVTESRTKTETLLAELWQELLGLNGIGIHDNFFEVGGHSLLATRLVSQVRKRFGVEVGLRSFFENATIQALAKQIDSAQTMKAPGSKSIKRASREQYRVNVSPQDAILLPEPLRKETAHS
ncbi:MAG TPA: amino acid adenylation domain-containing protein [Pyrinomonadaceae bacterium]